MDKRARLLLLTILLLCCSRPSLAVDARFDLIGPKIDVRVTRGDQTLPIAAVPNLQPGDKLWIHPDLPPTQSVKYLLICVFLRGNTNPPPDNWFTRIETWDPKVRAEGTFITVPAEAQQAVLFMAPETGGDFSTLRSAVRGKPAAFVRASQDLIEAGFEEARIEKYIASIRRVPPSDPAELQKHSDLLARTLALKPNGDCFKRPIDTQFTCLTQTGSQVVLDDGHLRGPQRPHLRPHRPGQLHHSSRRRRLFRLRRRHRRHGPYRGQPAHRPIPVHPSHQLPPERVHEPAAEHPALVPQS